MKLALVAPVVLEEGGRDDSDLLLVLAKALTLQGFDVEIFTTTAIGERTYEPFYRPGRTRRSDFTINRYNTQEPKEYRSFQLLTRWLFSGLYSRRDEGIWLRQAGPVVPAMVRHLLEREEEFDLFLLFGVTGFNNFELLRKLSKPKVLFIGDHSLELLNLRTFREALAQSRGLVFFGESRKALYGRLYPELMGKVPFMVTPPLTPSLPVLRRSRRFARKHAIPGPYILYRGSLEEEGVTRAIKYFFYLHKRHGLDLSLVLLGRRGIPLIEAEWIKVVEETSEVDEALSGAMVTLHPSLEDPFGYRLLGSLGSGRGCLVDGRNELYRERLARSGAGFFYSGFFDFERVVLDLLRNPDRASRAGCKGRKLYREKYDQEILLPGIVDFLQKAVV